MRTHAIAMVAALAGCVTSRPVMAPNGGQAHYIECPRSIDRCMDKAAELCPSGYDVIGSGGREGAIAQTNYYTGQTLVTPTFRGNMTVQCRWARPAQPYAMPAPSQPIPEATPTVKFRDAQGRIYWIDARSRDEAIRAGLTEVPE